MDNFHLYKTSPLLGGQLKWDLVLENAGGGLYVKDFHLTPISTRVPYNRYSYDNLINYPHQENIKRFYKEIESSFYQDYIDPQLVHDWPIVVNENEQIKPYDDTFFMGCKRGSYQLYGKEFEFLIPLWLENVNSSIAFTININNKNGKHIASQTLELNLNSVGNSFHDKFCKYLKDYFEYINIYDIKDTTTDVINIDLAKKTAYVTGIDASIGELVTRDISSLTLDLLSRERPLLEFDSMITNTVQNNKLILKQLFNFNLCFNFEDIISQIAANMTYGEMFFISIDAKLNGIDLEKRDIYTNFEYIPRVQLGQAYDEENNNVTPSNVLDYLKDNQCVDIITMNKVVQKIPHWQLVNNSNYIFNLYNGFSGEVDGVVSSHYYNETPNIEQFEYDKLLNNMGWANYKIMNGVWAINEIKYLTNKFIDEGLFTLLKGWVKNLYYGAVKDTYVCLGTTDDGFNSEDIKAIKDNSTVILDDNIYINIIYDNIYIIWSNNRNKLTFAYIKKILKSLDFSKEKYHLLKSLLDAMESLREIQVVALNRSLYIDRCKSPSLSTNEIEYYKRDKDFFEYLLRYDGKIKPNFISEPKNKIYIKRFDEEDLSNFTKYINSGYAPKFPSIDYFSLKSFDLTYSWDNYSSILKDLPYDYPDVKWFNQSRSLMLIPSLKYDLVVEDKNGDGSISKEELCQVLRNKIIATYRYNSKDESKIDYTISQYNITYDLQETSFEGNKTIFKYIVKFDLK